MVNHQPPEEEPAGEELPPDELAILEETEAEIRGGGAGPGGGGGLRGWASTPFVERPYTTYDRWSKVLFEMRTASTIEEFVRIYTLRRRPSVDRVLWRRFVPVYLDEAILKTIPDGLRYLILEKPKDQLRDDDVDIGLDPNRFTGPALEEGMTILQREQGFWTLDGEQTDTSSRKNTGYGNVDKEDEARYYREFIETNELKGYYDVPFAEIPPEARTRLWQGRWEAHFSATLGPKDANGVRNWREGAFNFGYIHRRYEEYLREGLAQDRSLEELEKDSSVQARFLERLPSDCLNHWRLTESFARACRDAIEGQDATECIEALEALDDLYSVVIRGARVEKTTELVSKWNSAKGESENVPETRFYIQRGTARVKYSTRYDADKDRKGIDHIHGWLAERQLVDGLDLPASRPVSARDSWFGGPAGRVQVKNLILDVPIDPQVYLGPLANLPPDFHVPPATQVWMVHMDRLARFVDSARTLIQLARFVAGGGKLTDADFREKYEPHLINWEAGVVRIWEGRDKEKHPEEYGLWFEEEGEGRELICLCPRNDWALWVDGPWTIQNDNYYYDTWMILVNEALEEAKLPEECRFTFAYYGRHKDFAWKIWKHQPAEPLEARFRRELREQEDMGEWHLRKTIYRQFAGLPFLEPDGRVDDLVALLHELLKMADGRTDDLVAYLAHGAAGDSRGFSFATATSLVMDGYGLGYMSSKTAQEYINGLYEIALKCKFYDTMRGAIEAAHFDPAIRKDPQKIMGLITTPMLSRGINHDYGVILARVLHEIAGRWTTQQLPYSIEHSKHKDKLEQDFLEDELKRLLYTDRIQRIKDHKLLEGRWIVLSSGLHVPNP